MTGLWVNEYGSVMALRRVDHGRLHGEYMSTTGSTGRYRVTGRVVDRPPAAFGQPLALAIGWRSLDPGGEEPSQHWVSGLSGQLTTATSGRPVMLLRHALVATTAFPPQAGPGTYIDTLTYRRTSDLADPDARLTAEPARVEASATRRTPASLPLSGRWRDERGTTLELSVEAETGQVHGSVSTAEGRWVVDGLADVRGGQTETGRYGLSLTYADEASGRAVSVAGALDRASDELIVLQMVSRSTAPHETYLQSTMAGLVFRRR